VSPTSPEPELVALLDGMRGRFRQMELQLASLQRDIQDFTAPPPAPKPAPPPHPVPPRVAAPAPPPSPTPPPRPAPRPAASRPPRVDLAAMLRRWRGELTLSDFLGLRTLAWIGGAITLLGIAFFYVVANQRGWVGAGGRVLLGTGISLGLVALAFDLRMRRGQLEAALAVAGTGVAGLYVTLFAATHLYGFVPPAAGLPLALAVAALGVGIGLAWSAQPMAVLGLAGAGLAPPLVSGVSPASVAFVAIAAGAALSLLVVREWRVVAAVSTAILAPQLGVLVLRSAGDATPLGWNPLWQTALVAGAVWAGYLAATLARHLRRAGDAPDRLTASALVGVAGYALLAAGLLFEDTTRGVVMAGLAAAYGALALLPWVLGRRSRDLESLLAAAGLTAMLVAIVDLLGGGTRAVALAAEAGMLTVVAHRVRERRFQLAGMAYLAAAAGFTLLREAPPADLVRFPPEAALNAAGTAIDAGALAGSIASVTALAVAFGLLAALGRPVGTTAARRWTLAAWSAAVAAGLYAAATVTLGGFAWMDLTRRSFENGHTVVTAIVGAAGLALLAAGLRRRSTDLRTGGLVLLAAGLGKLFLYDLVALNLMARAVAFIAVGLALIAGGALYQRLWQDGEPSGREAAA
jgi:uncharacterized membrane protein